MSEIGKIPPSAIDLEEGVLGAVMLEKKAIFRVYNTLDSKHFYKDAHSKIYRAITTLYKAASPIDILTVCDQLRKDGVIESVGGAYYISTLTNSVASSANIEYHSRIIVEKWMQRELIRICSTKISSSYDSGSDVFTNMETLISEVHSISKSIKQTSDRDISDFADEIMQDFEDSKKGLVKGVLTGCESYDQDTKGHQKGHMIVYAGRPGMGKSARVANEVIFQLQQGKSVVIHSLDMPARDFVTRILALHLNVHINDITHNKLSLETLEKGLNWLRKQRLKLYQDARLEFIYLETQLRHSMVGVDICYIDHIQKVKVSGSRNNYSEVTEVSGSIKRLALDLDIPVVALSQLSRAVETRGGDKKPQLSDLRESGAIEQDADVIEFLYRPEYYGITQDEDGENVAGFCFYLNAKLRGGKPNSERRMQWDGPKNKLSNPVDVSDYTVSDIPINGDFDDETPF